MAKEKIRDRKIGRSKVDNSNKLNPKFKSFIYTSTTIIILIIFFIVNNTRDEPKSGPYPPVYENSQNKESIKKDTTVKIIDSTKVVKKSLN